MISSILLLLAVATTNSLAQKYNGNTTEYVEYILLNNENSCNRKCVKNAPPMTCRYHFVLEYYHTLSKACFSCPFNQQDCFRPDCIPGDGNKRSVVVINRKLPGPSIEVCLGDEVIIDVENQLGSESTTIHWHGHHQKFTPYMDGVPFVTQCPIQPGNTFRYAFAVRNSGTHFWHSHSGFQRAEGAFGPFIVRVPEEDDPHANLYDYDLSSHIISILDWGRETGLEKFLAHHHDNGDNKPATLLVNGFGKFKIFQTEDNETVATPLARFQVEQGYRYRFRVINAGFLNCPIEISVDNHTLTAISGDGNDFNATEVESIVTYAGERFDFVINADQPKALYWIRFSGLMDCDERFRRAHQVAVLEYQGVKPGELPPGEPSYENSKKPGIQLNSLNRGTEDTSRLRVSMPEIASLDPWDDSLKPKADFQYFVAYDFYKLDNPHFNKFPHYGFKNVTDPKKQLQTPQLNHISMKLLPFPMLSQRHQIVQEKMVCNETTVEGCETDYCECTHIVNIPLNSVVELVMIDKGFAFDANHPFHLHGHSFRVVAMEKMGPHVNVSQVLQKDENGLIKRNLENPPLKDTVTVPDGGYTIVRFKASNPGYWLFHCHIEFHVEVGMALVFKIGENAEMPPVPPGFPRCGDYVPSPQNNGNNRTDCDTENIFWELLGQILPSVYNEYCPGGSSSSSSNYASRNNLILVLLWAFVLLLIFD